MIVDLLHFAQRLYDPLVLAGSLLVAGFLASRLVFSQGSNGRLLSQLVSFFGFTALLMGEGVYPFRPTPIAEGTLAYAVMGFFKVAWWLTAAWLTADFIRAILVFKRQPVETRFLQDLCAGFIYVGGILAIIAYVFDMPVSGLLAASGVLAIVLGLALQSTLGDLFSGVALNLAKPYSPGDWVILDGGPEGRVIETNWRATQILTSSNDLAIIPNSIIAKAKLVNASRVNSAHGVTVVARLDPMVAPALAVDVLETAMTSANRILRSPRAVVMVRSLDAQALECEVQFFVSLIDQVADAQNEVFDLIFRHCASAGIRMAPPRGSALALAPRPARPAPQDAPLRLLEHLPIFGPLSEAERQALAPKMTRRTYKSGDVLVEQGIVVEALFILYSGVLAGFQRHDDREDEILRFAPGDCFGQSSVLTGAPTKLKVTALTKVVVFEIAKSDLAPILKERPAIADELGLVLARREATGRARLDQLADLEPHSENLAARLADRVRLLFGLA